MIPTLERLARLAVLLALTLSVLATGGLSGARASMVDHTPMSLARMDTGTACHDCGAAVPGSTATPDCPMEECALQAAPSLAPLPPVALRPASPAGKTRPWPPRTGPAVAWTEGLDPPPPRL